MPDRQQTILCVTSYEKGTEFFRACKEMGWRVLLLTVEKFRNGDWPRNMSYSANLGIQMPETAWDIPGFIYEEQMPRASI